MLKHKHKLTEQCPFIRKTASSAIFSLLSFESHLTVYARVRCAQRALACFIQSLQIDNVAVSLSHCAYVTVKTASPSHHHQSEQEMTVAQHSTAQHIATFPFGKLWLLMNTVQRVWSFCCFNQHIQRRLKRMNDYYEPMRITTAYWSFTIYGSSQRALVSSLSLSCHTPKNFYFEFINFVRNNKLFSYGPIFKQ